MTDLNLSDNGQELLPCPWCEKTVMHRHALHVSDGNTDDIIHAHPTICGMQFFSIDTADRGISVAKAWNSRKLPQSLTQGSVAELVRAARLIFSHKDIGDFSIHTGGCALSFSQLAKALAAFGEKP